MTHIGPPRCILKISVALQGHSSGHDDVAQTVHDILVDRAEAHLDLAQKIATKRSGQRGHTARQDLLAAEQALADVKAQSVDLQKHITPDVIHKITTEVFSAYESIDVDGGEARARAILRGLGFKDEEVTEDGKEVANLSGGWRMRVMLGKALFIKPDILLLDEPSKSRFFSNLLCTLNAVFSSANHLDLPAILWLENYLLTTSDEQGQTVVIVSHDRNFLDAVTDETIIFRDKKLVYHPGNYDDWERNTEEQRKRKTRLKEVTLSPICSSEYI